LKDISQIFKLIWFDHTTGPAKKCNLIDINVQKNVTESISVSVKVWSSTILMQNRSASYSCATTVTEKSKQTFVNAHVYTQELIHTLIFLETNVMYLNHLLASDRWCNSGSCFTTFNKISIFTTDRGLLTFSHCICIINSLACSLFSQYYLSFDSFQHSNLTLLTLLTLPLKCGPKPNHNAKPNPNPAMSDCYIQACNRCGHVNLVVDQSIVIQHFQFNTLP